MTEEDRETFRQHALRMGLQPHEINRVLRESEEHDVEAEEILRYVREVMCLDDEHQAWALSRVIVRVLTEAWIGDPLRPLRLAALLDKVVRQVRAHLVEEAAQRGGSTEEK